MIKTIRDAEDVANAVVEASLSNDSIGLDRMLVDVSSAEMTACVLLLGRWLADELRSHR